MAHNHNQEAINYNHNTQGIHQPQQIQHDMNENATYYNQNNSQCVNLQYARQNNQLYGNRYVLQPANHYGYRTLQKYNHPNVKQQNLYYHQQRNSPHQHFGQSVYNQQHIIQQLTNQPPQNQQQPNQQQPNQQQPNQQESCQQPPNQQESCQQPPNQQDTTQPQEGENCNPNLENQPLPSSQPNETKPTTCSRKNKIVKSKSKSEKSKYRIFKTKSRTYKCKCKPCVCKSKPCKSNPSKNKRATCKCKPIICKCKSGLLKPCICKIKPCKCHKIKIKICHPCFQKNENNPNTCQNENKENKKNNENDGSKCLLKEQQEKKEEDKCDISAEMSKANIDVTKDVENLDEPSRHTCYCELHSKSMLKEHSTITIPELSNYSRYQNENHGILKKNSEYYHKDEDSRSLLLKNHGDQQHNYICECHSKEMKALQNKIKQENNKNQEKSLNRKYKKDKCIDQYQATIQRKNTLPHYHLDKNRVLLPKNHNDHKNIDRHNYFYELHTHDFSKRQNEFSINQATTSGKSDARYQDNQKSNYHYDDQSQLQLTNQMKNQQDQESRLSCFEGKPKEIHVRLNDITTLKEQKQHDCDIVENQDKLEGKNTKDQDLKSKNTTDKIKNRNDEENNKETSSQIYHETGDPTLKPTKLKSSKLQYLQQKRKDMIQDSISFCSVM